MSASESPEAEGDKVAIEAPDSAEDRVARARMRRAAAADEDDIAPKLPRGSGFKISKGHLFKITLTAALLVMLIAIQRPCADAVSKFVTSFDDEGSAANDKKRMPKPGTVDGSGSAYEMIGGDMTEAELEAAIERARARAGFEPDGRAGSNHAGSNHAGSNHGGSNHAGSNHAGSN